MSIDALEIDTRMNTLQGQRNNALNEIVLLHGALAIRDQQINQLQGQLVDLEAKIEKLITVYAAECKTETPTT